jgi:hypothetical protein
MNDNAQHFSTLNDDELSVIHYALTNLRFDNRFPKDEPSCNHLNEIVEKLIKQFRAEGKLRNIEGA